MTTSFPLLPYAGTSGWSGTDTSRSAALYLDAHGITAQTQRGVVTCLLQEQSTGATVKEIRESHPELGHHGRISGALSVLHKEGQILMLTERRDRCHVYVLPDHADDRPTVAHHSNKAAPEPAVCPLCLR